MNALPFVMLLVLALAFWLMVLRPAKARQSAQLRVVNSLKAGQRVMTTAGLFGVIRDLDDESVGLEIADGVVVRYVREAIAKVVEEPGTESAAPDSVVLDTADDVVDVSQNQ